MKVSISYCILFILLLIACGKKTEEYVVGEETITESVYASGLVKSKNQYQVFPKMNGLVDALYVEEGALVHKGQPILRLMNSSSALNARTARLAAELASQNTKGEKLRELAASIELAKIKVRNDSMLWVRQQNLWSNNIGTLVELEQRELNYRNSLNAYASAILRYEDTKKQLDFLAQQAKNNSEISATQEDDYIVRSESEGRVYSILKEKGEMASTMNPIAVIGDAENYYVEMQVDEYDITRINEGQKIMFGLDSYKGEVFEGRITKINRIMDERSRSFKVEAEFTKFPPKLFPNLSLEANIIIQSKNRVLTVPRGYLISDSMVLDKDKNKVSVETGLKDYNKVEITGGLKKGDIILYPGK